MRGDLVPPPNHPHIPCLFYSCSISLRTTWWWPILNAETCSCCTQCSGLSLIDNTVVMWLTVRLIHNNIYCLLDTGLNRWSCRICCSHRIPRHVALFKLRCIIAMCLQWKEGSWGELHSFRRWNQQTTDTSEEEQPGGLLKNGQIWPAILQCPTGVLLCRLDCYQGGWFTWVPDSHS